MFYSPPSRPNIKHKWLKANKQGGDRLTQAIINRCLRHYYEGGAKQLGSVINEAPFFAEIREALLNASNYFALVVDDDDYFEEYGIDLDEARKKARADYELDAVVDKLNHIEYDKVLKLLAKFEDERAMKRLKKQGVAG